MLLLLAVLEIGQHKQHWNYFAQAAPLREVCVEDSYRATVLARLDHLLLSPLTPFRVGSCLHLTVLISLLLERSFHSRREQEELQRDSESPCSFKLGMIAILYCIVPIFSLELLMQHGLIPCAVSSFLST